MSEILIPEFEAIYGCYGVEKSDVTDSYGFRGVDKICLFSVLVSLN